MSSDWAFRFATKYLQRYTPDTPRGRAVLAAYRRGLGKPPGAAPEMLKYIERGLTPEDGPARADAAYIVASLYGMHPAIGGYAFGTALASIRRRESGDEDPGVERRVIALLDAPAKELPEHLRHLMSLIKARSGSPIDYAQLLDDILDWDRDDRCVQKRWASQFWRSTAPQSAGAPGDPEPSPVEAE